MEVYETSSGDTEIRDLSRIRIKSEADVGAIIRSGVAESAIA